MRGLDRETLYFVKERFPTTLDEAIELSAEADLDNITWNSIHGVRVVPRGSAEINNFDIFGSRKRVAAIQSSFENSQNGKSRSLSSIQCFNCEEFGHYKRTCPKLKKVKVNLNYLNNNKIKCDYCEFDNHVVREC